MKFEFLNNYLDQQTKRAEEHAELVRREASALEEVHALKAEYEKTIRGSLVARKDATDALNAINGRIEAAERAYKWRRHEREMYSSVVQPEIKEMDVIEKFNETFIPEFNSEVLNPVLDDLLAAKKAYFDAIFAYHDCIQQFESERQLARNQFSDSYYYKFKDVGFQTKDRRGFYTIQKSDIDMIDRGTRPDFNPERKFN